MSLSNWNRDAGMPEAQCGTTMVLRALGWLVLVLGGAGLVGVLMGAISGSTTIPLAISSVFTSLLFRWAALQLDASIFDLRLKVAALTPPAPAENRTAEPQPQPEREEEPESRGPAPGWALDR